VTYNSFVSSFRRERELEAHAPREIRDHYCQLSTAGNEGAFDDQSNWAFSSAIALAS